MASKTRKARKAAAREKRRNRLLAVTSALGLTKDQTDVTLRANAVAPQPPPSPPMTNMKPDATTAPHNNYVPRQNSAAATGSWACGHGLTRVFKIGTGTVYAGGELDIKRSDVDWKLLICCAGSTFAPEPTIYISPGAEGLLSPEVRSDLEIPYLSIRWPDGGIPPMTLKQWGALAVSIANIDGAVGVYCMGGHGRTGTALAILGCLSGAIPDDVDPVGWLRDHYCDSVVETTGQIEYIKRLTGRDITERASLSAYWEGYSAYGGSKVTPTGVTPQSDPKPATTISNTAATSDPDKERFASNTATVSGDGVNGVPIVNRAGDVIGWDFTSKAAGRAEILADDDEEPIDTVEDAAEKAAVLEEMNEYYASKYDPADQPWQKWGK